MTATRRISKIIKDGIEYNIVGGGSEAVDSYLDPDSENPVQNKAIKAAIDTKLDAPAEEGEVGQFVRKGADGNEWVSGDLSSLQIDSADYSAMRGPCAEGFHIPNNTEIQGLVDAMSYLGYTTMADYSNYLHIPKSGYISDDGTNKYYVGSRMLFWGCNDNANTGKGFLGYNNGSSDIIQLNQSLKSQANCIRPFKDGFVTPDNTWTVVSGTLGSAGIFRNQTEGIISITSDGVSGYTIADKNLGATTVYNNGDTLSEANCGKYYQWGNNYGFPFTGTFTTSSTKINASIYGPGNYYSSSTFITTNPRDNSSNHNLRGGTTGVIQLGAQLTVGEDRIGLATETSDGFMSAYDKKILGRVSYKVDVLLVGGGGGGGGGSFCNGYTGGGGGGAGEVKIIEGLNVSDSSISVVVGSGGSGGASGSNGSKGNNGGVSKFGNTYAIGGGGGGGGSCNNSSIFCGNDGGSGGGSGGFVCNDYNNVRNSGYAKGIGGNHGGIPGLNNSGYRIGGGGGGAGRPGGTSRLPIFEGGGISLQNTSKFNALGGAGIVTCFGGTIRCIGGGGGGGNAQDSGQLKLCSNSCQTNVQDGLRGANDYLFNGACYGGGYGGYYNSCAGCGGTANTGGGGGGAAFCNSSYRGGSGGSGLVIVRYPTNGGIKCATGGTVTTCTIEGISYKIHTFTSNGTFCIVC